MHENPSADKFEPPPALETPTFEKSKFLRIAFGLLFVGAWGGVHWLQSLPGRRWVTAAGAVAGFGMLVFEYALHRRRADRLGGTDPYTPPTHLTR